MFDMILHCICTNGKKVRKTVWIAMTTTVDD